MFSRQEPLLDENGAPVLTENDEVQMKEINNYKYWGSYEQGLNKPVIKLT